MIGLAEIIVLGLAGHRLWRLAAVDDMPLLERFRAWAFGEYVVARFPGAPGSPHGGTTEVKHYKRGTLRTLVECPWCLGTYLAVGLVVVFAEWPWGARWIVGALAVGEVIGLVGRNLDPVEDD